MTEPSSHDTKIQLPDGFLLGAASSAHQVEGNNFNNDWWHSEQQDKLPKSGTAADHYNRYEEDFALAQQIGLNAFRISLEWSRIEPLPGQWNAVAIEHYRKVLKKMKELGFTRMVTLHHFTLPQWLAEKGGFETADGVQAFARFAWFVAKNLGEEIDLWITINEPENYVQLGYRRGVWPPFKKNTRLMLKVFSNLAKAHRAAYYSIKEVKPDAQISIAKNNVYYEPFANKFLDKLTCWVSNYGGNEFFLNKIKNQLDFIGLNFYNTRNIKFGLNGYKIMNTDNPKSDMGWQTYPKGIYHLLMKLKKYNKPIYITENGIANAHDDMRKDYIRQHLYWVTQAINQGSDVRGYFYWSLTDSYELQDGYNPKFGLVEINFDTQQRRVRESASVFKEIKN